MSIDTKLEKLTQSIESKYEEVHRLRFKKATLDQELIQIKRSCPHPLQLPHLNESLAGLQYELKRAQIQNEIQDNNEKSLRAEM